MATPKDGAKDFFRLIVAFFLPPLAVFWQVGLKSQVALNVFVALAQLVGTIAVLVEAGNAAAHAADFGQAFSAAAVYLVAIPLVWLPAVIHAIWVISVRDDHGNWVSTGTHTFVSLLLAVLVPPIGVLVKRGFGGALLVNVIMTAACYLPGQLHAAWVITSDQ